jgi:hypothetical protein
VSALFFSGAVEDEVDFGLDDLLPSRIAKNGRKKKNDIEMEQLKKRTTVKSMRYTALDLNQVTLSGHDLMFMKII